MVFFDPGVGAYAVDEASVGAAGLLLGHVDEAGVVGGEFRVGVAEALHGVVVGKGGGGQTAALAVSCPAELGHSPMEVF